MNFSTALAPYARAFENKEAPFLHVHDFPGDGSVASRSFTRNQFWELGRKAAGVLTRAGVLPGQCFLHFFGANRVADLAFRLGSAMTGAVPVTINWQADDRERIIFKMELTDSLFLIHDHLADASLLESVLKTNPNVKTWHVEGLQSEIPLEPERFYEELSVDDPKIIIFTSGTTGLPKGVCHAYSSYEVNKATFDQFLAIPNSWAALVVNPLHHANATAISDWALRHPGAQIHLFERYSTPFWKVLTEISEQGLPRMITPLTARHFDFLEHLREQDALPVDLTRLKHAMATIDFLIGSAPVGPSTVDRLLRYAARVPTVRFGSTETCLQVMGIPRYMLEQARLEAFKRGWSYQDGQRCGYFIGRPHQPYTEVRIVESVTPGEPGFMRDREEGVPGYVVTRGGNLMTAYVKNPEGTEAVFHEDWYTGLLDVGYYLINPEDGRPDFYWMSRESSLLIKGGANYSYEQINHDLKLVLVEQCGFQPQHFDVAVVGLRLDSEHEDNCCATVSLDHEMVQGKQEEVIYALKTLTRKSVRPDHVRFAHIPRNFKGAVTTPELKIQFKEWLDAKPGK